jgi:hypothetical protein
LHTVRAAAADVESIADVRVKAKEEEEEYEYDNGGGYPMPGKRLIRWQGAVPPQKWMNLYTKVLSRFTSSPELKLEVSFEVPIDSEQAQSKVDETRSGLKELGLDESGLSS